MLRQGKPMPPNRARFDLASGRHSAFMEVRKPLSEKAMSTHQTLRVQVTDTNQRPRGVMTIEADFDHLGPYRVQHDGQAYWFTGKSGTHRASGVATREMATADDARLWITLGGTAIWED